MVPRRHDGTAGHAGDVLEVIERTPDGHIEVWLLYSPEPFAPDSIEERQINLWVRRASVFTSRQAAVEHLNALLGRTVIWREYDPLFPELWIGTSHGHRWLMEPAPLNPPGGAR